ncbi:hypothetical protein [Halalkalibacillus halophilus]|uniref:hypothetical protein n=1 Tax=Halalkalibacillus halophilus TaxID=392827 RepID=UPI00040F7C99|nr:hypothetical protein [Halalkalibacillus halophilus]
MYFDRINNKNEIELFVRSLSSPEQSKDFFLNGLTNSSNTVSLAVRKGHEIIGVLHTWHNTFHPHITYMSMIIDPTFNLKSIAVPMLEQLKTEESEMKNRMQISFCSTDPLVNVFKEVGAIEVRRTYMPTIALRKKCINKEWNNDYNAIPLADLTNAFEKGQAIEFIHDTYIRTYQANPPANFSNDVWERLIFAEDTLLDHSYVITSVKDGAIKAFSLLHHIDTQTVEVGWVGADSANSFDLLDYVIVTQWNALVNQGYEKLEGEFDSTSPYAMHVLKSLSPNWEKALVTLQFDLNSLNL